MAYLTLPFYNNNTVLSTVIDFNTGTALQSRRRVTSISCGENATFSSGSRHLCRNYSAFQEVLKRMILRPHASRQLQVVQVYSIPSSLV